MNEPEITIRPSTRASINLLKFFHDDDTFDGERFRKITELIITAMDISICCADFPTERIAATTRAFRQLGIGYANLGALLMATGHAYDSEAAQARHPRARRGQRERPSGRHDRARDPCACGPDLAGMHRPG